MYHKVGYPSSDNRPRQYDYASNSAIVETQRLGQPPPALFYLVLRSSKRRGGANPRAPSSACPTFRFLLPNRRKRRSHEGSQSPGAHPQRRHGCDARRHQDHPLHDPVQPFSPADASEGDPFPLQERDGVRREDLGQRVVEHRVQDKREDEPEEPGDSRAVEATRELHEVFRLRRAAAGVERQGRREVVSGLFEASSRVDTVYEERGTTVSVRGGGYSCFTCLTG